VARMFVKDYNHLIFISFVMTDIKRKHPIFEFLTGQ